ncbi:MAG: ABC transporter ATP-binding protein [bacterium]
MEYNQKMGVIEITNLSKHFGSNKAVDDISMSVEEGEILGFIGPNGAGKTTTISCMLGLLKPTKGSITINGLDAWEKSPEIMKSLGSIPTDPYFYSGWKGSEYFNYIESIKGKASLLKELIKDFEFIPNLTIRTLSTGNKQKLSIIISLMHFPKVLVMDEPTRGLDPILQSQFYRYLKKLSSNGTTVFMSSHNLSEVESVCSSVAIIKSGKLVEVGNVKALQNKKMHIIKMTLKDPKILTDDMVRKANGQIVSHVTNYFEIRISGDLNPFLSLLPKLNVIDMSIGSASLEELFLEYYK